MIILAPTYGGNVTVYSKPNTSILYVSIIVLTSKSPTLLIPIMTCGGFSDAKEGGPEEQQILDGLKESAQEQLGATFEEWTLHSFSTQVVAGVIYMMRVSVDGGEVVHVKVIKPLPHTNQPPSIMNIARGKTLEDPFEP
jgi:hypothetical protein